MATVRPRVMPMPERDEGREGRIVPFKLDLDEDDIITKILSFMPDRDSSTSPTSPSPTSSSPAALGCRARKISSWCEISPSVLGAEFGASRPLIQKGWIGSDRQIGQTGKTIRPKLYIAAGISGAIQHRVGVEGADMIVAINTDKNAPIMDFAHVAIITDAVRLLPALTEAFRKRLSPHSNDRLAG